MAQMRVDIRVLVEDQKHGHPDKSIGWMRRTKSQSNEMCSRHGCYGNMCRTCLVEQAQHGPSHLDTHIPVNSDGEQQVPAHHGLMGAVMLEIRA